MPCQVCIGNKTFGPIFKDELHNTTQANEAGLPNDGMLYLITRCRQSGYATPKSMVSVGGLRAGAAALRNDHKSAWVRGASSMS